MNTARIKLTGKDPKQLDDLCFEIKDIAAKLGVVVSGPVGATAGVLTGISLNGAADVKAVHFNYAANWAGADTLAASGTVVIKWTSLA